MNKKADEKSTAPAAKENTKKRAVKKAAAPSGKAVGAKKDTAKGKGRKITKETAAPQKKAIKESPAKSAAKGQNKVPDAFLSDLRDLAKIFEANPGIIEPIRDVFEYHLVDPIDRKTFPRIVNAMSMLLGPAPTMVLITGCHVNSVSFFEDLLGAVKDDKSAKAAVWIIQQLTSIYGNRVQKAYSLSSGTMDEDWHTIDVNTFRREGNTPLWLIDMKLAQYNGNETHLKMTPDSAYQLIEILMTEFVDNIPAEQTDPDLVEKCREHCKEFYEKFYGNSTRKNEEEHPAGYA